MSIQLTLIPRPQVMRAEILDTVHAARRVVKEGSVKVPVYVDEWNSLHGPVMGSRLAVGVGGKCGGWGWG